MCVQCENIPKSHTMEHVEQDDDEEEEEFTQNNNNNMMQVGIDWSVYCSLLVGTGYT